MYCNIFPPLYPPLVSGTVACVGQVCGSEPFRHAVVVAWPIFLFARLVWCSQHQMYLAFECIGCLNSRPEADCAALLYANTQVPPVLTVRRHVVLVVCGAVPCRR